MVAGEGCTAVPSASSLASPAASTCSISTVSTSQRAASSRTFAGSVKLPAIAWPDTMPAGEVRPLGSSTVSETPSLLAACAIMRPSWPPPSTPTRSDEDMIEWDACLEVAEVVRGGGPTVG